MYCSTCGAVIAPGRTACSECGTRVLHRLPAEALAAGAGGVAVAARHCPRCGYQGEGLPYFSRGAHVAGLVAATALTAGAMGAGGIIYYVVRREHQICPRCGFGWGPHGHRSVVRAGNGMLVADGEEPLPMVRAVSGKQGGAIAMFVFGAILLAAGIGATEMVPIVFALAFFLGGFVMQRSARQAREERRAALLAGLQLPVLKLAAERGGRLTVTETAAALGWTMPRAEKVLNSLDDGLRVDSEVSDEGVIVYEFRELQSLPKPPALPPRDS